MSKTADNNSKPNESQKANESQNLTPEQQAAQDQANAQNQATQQEPNTPATPAEPVFTFAQVQEMMKAASAEGAKTALALVQQVQENERLEKQRREEELKAEADWQADLAKAAQKSAIARTDSTEPIYGNRDYKQQFDLRKKTNLQELPEDKVTIALPAFNKDAEGTVIGLDIKNTAIQFLDFGVHDANEKPDNKTGATTYQLLSVSPIVLHDPRD